MRTVTAKENLREQEFKALDLLHQAVVQIALDCAYPRSIARNALKLLAIDHPDLVELLFAHAAEHEGKRRGEPKCNSTVNTAER